jgi:hypothetical protein
LAQKALINLKHTNSLNIALIFPFTIEADFGVAVRFIGFQHLSQVTCRTNGFFFLIEILLL